MKKPLIIVCCVIVLCSVLAVPILLQTPPVASEENPSPTPQNIQPTPQATPQPSPLSPSPPTPQSSPQTTPMQTPTATQQPTNNLPISVHSAVQKAIQYLDSAEEPYALLNLDILYRRFGITEFNDSLQRYDQHLSANSDPLLRVFRRIADYNNTVYASDFNAVADPIDVLTVPALYSDRRSLPNDYYDRLAEALEQGGYAMTHALLATIWLKDNNCAVLLPQNYLSALYHNVAALTDSGLPISDLQIEAAAFLYMAGQGGLVNPSFVQNVISAQNPNGGWSMNSATSEGSNWHPSVLALMFLLHIDCPAGSYPPMLASAS